MCKSKDADQLCSNCTADQRLCFCFSDSTISLKSKVFELLVFLCDCTDWFVLDLVGNPIDRFSGRYASIDFIAAAGLFRDVIGCWSLLVCLLMIT